MRLLPREEKFFKSFLSQAELTRQAAQLLCGGVRQGNGSLGPAVAEIASLKKRGKQAIYETAQRLKDTFVTPIDPEDIHALSASLYAVLDVLENAAYRLHAYELRQIPPGIQRICDLNLKCVEAIRQALIALDAEQPVAPACREVSLLEEEVDTASREAICELFSHPEDPLEVVKLKEIYDLLEQTTDECEGVADVLTMIAVKNS